MMTHRPFGGSFTFSSLGTARYQCNPRLTPAESLVLASPGRGTILGGCGILRGQVS